jgi:hypothetical protein
LARGSRAFATGLVLICATVALGAHAEPSAADRALAQSLFDQARELMDAGNYAEACPKLVESQRMDPGGGTLLNLGICYEKAGKTASAWAIFEEAAIAARKDGRPERERFAKDHVNALKPRLSHLTILLDAGGDIPGLQVRLDGTELRRASLGASMPVDPGEHRVQASASGRTPWQQVVAVGDNADEQEVRIPVLAEVQVGPAASSSAPSDRPTPAAPAPEQPPELAVQPSSSVVPYVVGGAGAAFLGLGSYFGWRAKSSWDDRNEHCRDGVCDADAVRHGDDTKKFATLANVGVGVGVVGLAVGTYLFLSTSTPPPSQTGTGVRLDTNVGANAGSVTVGGVW